MPTPNDIAKLFSEVLGISCKTTDSFFDLGGDSLSAVNLMTDLSTRTGQLLDVSVLLDHQTPTELATHLGWSA